MLNDAVNYHSFLTVGSVFFRQVVIPPIISSHIVCLQSRALLQHGSTFSHININ